MSSTELEWKCLLSSRTVEGTKATVVRLASIAVSTSSHGGPRKLSIRGAKSTTEVADIGLLAIARCCTSLRALSLLNVDTIGDKGLLEIAKECHLIEQLDLRHCPSISNEGLVAIARSSPDLTSITIQSCRNVGDESLQAIAKYCPNLQSIAIKGCSLVSDQGVASLLSACSLLTTVKLQALKITDFSVAKLGCYGKAIKNLILSRLQDVSPEGFWMMGNAQGLEKVESLNISFCRMTDLSLQAVVKGCPKLKRLTLRKCCFASDNGFLAFEKLASSPDSSDSEYRKVTQVGIFNAIFISNSKLISLAIVKCMGIKELQTEFPLLQRSETLHSLSIRSCQVTGTTSLPIIGELCPIVHHLDFSGLNQITNTELLKLVDTSGLTKVDFSHCSNLTDDIIFILAMWHPLETLNINGCHLITDESLVRIGQCCRLLRELDVSKCSITDYGIHAALTGEVIRSLEALSLSGCSMISDMSSPAIERLEGLQRLNIRNCSSITGSTVELLTEKLGRCKILS